MDAQDPRLQVALVGLWGPRDLTPAGCAQPAERFVPLLVRAGINRDVLSATFGRGRRPDSATGRQGPFQPEAQGNLSHERKIEAPRPGVQRPSPGPPRQPQRGRGCKDLKALRCRPETFRPGSSQAAGWPGTHGGVRCPRTILDPIRSGILKIDPIRSGILKIDPIRSGILKIVPISSGILKRGRKCGFLEHLPVPIDNAHTRIPGA